ncbi:MAG: 3-methyl-2-oxobutanoate hydroxymethyltransferase [Firmicutes bacterium]|nr:3-methyl-2-oxobutanoate hydroxymethyltransferase [Bacillota bacterium]
MLAAKKQGRKITMVTSYDYSTAVLVSKSNVDTILVGDSAAMVMLGHPGTVPITLDALMIMATAVVKGAGHNTFIVGDMPFLSYEVNKDKAIENCGRYLKEAGCDAVKLEGGRRVAATVSAIVQAGIPVMGHIGLTPQTAAQLGGFKVQGKDRSAARAIVDDAIALEDAGVFSMVLEAVPTPVARIITERVKVPTIGIGAGPHCDGQVLVFHDMMGLFQRFLPKFVKQYVNLAPQIVEGLNQYSTEVAGGAFPAKEHTFSMKDEEVNALIEELKKEGVI